MQSPPTDMQRRFSLPGLSSSVSSVHKRLRSEVLLFPRFTFTFSTSQSNKGLIISVVLVGSDCRTLRKSSLPEPAGPRAFQTFKEAAKPMLANCWSFEAHGSERTP